MRSAVVAAGVALALLTGGREAHAYRPFDGTDADVAAHGEFELELAPVGYINSTDGPALTLPAVVFNYGIAKGFELVVDARQELALGTPHIEGGARLDRSRLLDTDVLVKMILRKGSLQDEDHAPGEAAPSGISLAMELGPLVPDIGGDDGVGFSDDVIASMRWHNVSAHLNTMPMFDRKHRAELFESLIVEGPFRWKVRPVTELAFEKEWYGPTTLSALGGVIARVSDALDLDVAGRAIDTDGQAGYEIRAGFTLGIAVYEPRTATKAPTTPEGEKP